MTHLVGTSRLLFWIGCVLCVLAEVYLVFVSREGSFTIAGFETYGVEEFAKGTPVSQAFFMQGDGLYAVNVQLTSPVRTTARLRWTLSQGSNDFPPLRRIAEGEQTIVVGRRKTWARFEGVRDGSSNDRWYTVEVQQVEAHVEGHPELATDARIMATSDNPDRGGVLWVGAVRQPGSLVMQAERRGRTVYRRFLADVAPNLPRALRNPIVQWSLAIAIHWAFIVFAYAVMADAAGHPTARRTS